MTIFLTIMAILVVIAVFGSQPESLNYRGQQIRAAYRSRPTSH